MFDQPQSSMSRRTCGRSEAVLMGALDVHSARVVALFPGLGSEYAGMAVRHFDRYPVVRQTFAEAADTLGFDIAELCLRREAAGRLSQMRLETERVARICAPSGARKDVKSIPPSSTAHGRTCGTSPHSVGEGRSYRAVATHRPV